MLKTNRDFIWYWLPRSLVFVAILGGCALSREGVVDFRKTAGISPTQRQSAAENRDKNADTGAVAPVSLIKKLIVGDESSLIDKGDSITIRLAQALIADFWELGVFSPHRGFRSNGEIAIVVNAFEFSPDDTSKDFDFTPEGQKRGRLVFFSKKFGFKS